MPVSLPPCPRLWNCVSSNTEGPPRNRTDPFPIRGEPEAAFARLKKLVEELPRTEIVAATDDYFRAECSSRIGFVDDLEFALWREDGVIHVRSAARWGGWDAGVNRQRVETIRERYEGAA